MGTVIDRVDIAHSRWRDRHSALHLAVTAAKDCLQRAGCDPDELDLVVNAGIYRDRNMGEPALAALIQDDIGANPEDPHPGAHGTFSFDIANGACGVLTALQIVDGFLRAHSIHRALVVASDADPGHGMSEHFPFSASGAALLCGWSDDDYGLSRVSWVNTDGEDAEAFSATVGFADARNRPAIHRVGRYGRANSPRPPRRRRGACLDAASCARLSAIDMIVAAPARPGFRAALGDRLGVPVEPDQLADDERMHTAALAAAFERQVRAASRGRAGSARRRRCGRHRGCRAVPSAATRVRTAPAGKGGRPMEQLTAFGRRFPGGRGLGSACEPGGRRCVDRGGAGPGYEEFVSAFAERVADHPALQAGPADPSARSRPTRMGGRPALRHLARHLHRIALPHPGGDAELFEMIAT